MGKKRTPKNWHKEWENIYNSSNVTDWEKIPQDNLYKFIENANINLDNINSILEIGCGRGQRLIYLLINEKKLRRKKLKVKAIDISESAIKGANENQESYCKFEKIKINFETHDILEYRRENNEQYDLVIDWMCFHEIYEHERKKYINLIKDICKMWFILTIFSKEGSSVNGVELINNTISKYQFSFEEIESFFKDEFEIVQVIEQSKETPHPDGTIRSKRTYLLMKKS